MKFFFAVIFLVNLAQAQSGAPREMIEFLRENKVKLIPENVDPGLVWDFKQELRKFPQDLLQEMIAKGSTITLIEGRGVTDDPSFRATRTFDGRSWDNVPGAGGNPSQRQPTRIVVNRLHERGSVNLFLHEHAHALNSLYRSQGITRTRAWQEAFSRNPGAREVLLHFCGEYCLANDDESFAELFAIYYGGGRSVLERKSPGMAEFFRNLRKVRDLR